MISFRFSCCWIISSIAATVVSAQYYSSPSNNNNKNNYYYSTATTTTGGSNSYTTTTEESWFQRMGESFVSLLFGIVFFFVAPYLLFWNEGRAVKRLKQIKFVSNNTKPNVLSSNLPSNENQLVHVIGIAKPKNGPIESGDATNLLKDPVFGIPPVSSENIQNLIVLQRNVQMLQWVETSHSETEKTAGGGTRTETTYTYDKEWRSSPINSNNFNQRQYSNPPMEYHNETFYNKNGVELEITTTKSIFNLSDKLHHQIPTNEQYDTNIHGMPTSSMPMKLNLGGGGGGGGYYEYGSMNSSSNNNNNNPPSWANSATLEFGPQPADIGTYRVGWTFSGPQTVSIIAQQYNGNSLGEFVSKPGQAGQKQSFTICRLTPGEVSLQRMVESMKTENNIITWALRIVGFVLWGVAIQMTFKPLEVMFDLGTIPYFGLEPGTIISWLTGAVAFVIALILSLVVIAIAWVFYRPLLGITLLVVATGLLFLLPKIGSSTSSEEATDTLTDIMTEPPIAAATAESTAAGNDCPGGSMLACTDVCKDLVDQAYKSCIESCLTKCA